MKSSSIAVCLAIVACGGSPKTDPAPPGGGVEPPATDHAEPAQGNDAKVDDSAPAPEESRRIAAPPPPEGAPPAWLSQPTVGYRAGDALKYLPSKCNERVYIDAAGLVGNEKADVKKALERAVVAGEEERERARVRTVIRIVQESGADPVDTWREIAVCKSDGNPVIAVGIATDKPFEIPILVQKVKIGLEDAPGAVVRQGDVSMLTADGETFAQPAPGILLISHDKDGMLAAAQKKAGAAGFAKAKGHLVFGATKDADVAVKQLGNNLDVRVALALHGADAEAARKKPKDLIAAHERTLKGAAEQMKGTPLAPLGERLQAVKITIAGGKIAFTGSIDRTVVVAILKQAAAGELDKFLPRM